MCSCCRAEKNRDISMAFFLWRENLDRFLQRGFNAASDLEFAINRPRRRLVSRNLSIRDSHKGERCFILATGPSLNNANADQLASLSKEHTFAVNSFYKSKIASDVSPSYYVLMDNHYWGALSDDFERIHSKFVSKAPTFITDVRAKSFVPKEAHAYFLHTKNYPIARARADMSGNMSITMNVVGTAILSAIHMGFSEVYLMGLDHSLFANLTNNHCYDDSLDTTELPKFNLAFYLKYYHLATEFHYLITKTAQEKGVKIVNLSEGSLLDAYPIRPISYAL